MDLLRKMSRLRQQKPIRVDSAINLEFALANLYGIGFVMADIRRSLLDNTKDSIESGDNVDDEEEDYGEVEEDEDKQGDNENDVNRAVGRLKRKNEMIKEFGSAEDGIESNWEFWRRQTRNVLNFLVEDWGLSAILGIITAILSFTMDVFIEKLQTYHVSMYQALRTYSQHLALMQWIFHVVVLTFLSCAACRWISKQAVGSGIPEVKVIMHGFVMKNYLTVRTLIAKMIGLTLAIGGGLPIGKEGPFVHMGAIVATILGKMTRSCQYTAFFSNEGLETVMLSSGCAVGIACTFSAPVGAVLYAIESTSKYFAVKNYWSGFLAATCSAIVFRFANFLVAHDKSGGTITAYYQTNIPTESFLIEELPIFAVLGLLSGILAAFFIFMHQRMTLFREENRLFKAIFRKNFFAFTIFMAAAVAILTYPKGFGRFIAGQLTFRETMADFFSNCTMYVTNSTKHPCNWNLLQHWTGGPDGDISIFLSLTCYFITYFFLVMICISINVPAGVFVPSFIIGAANGRLIGEIMANWFPNGLRGSQGTLIFPGLYAVVGAAAYTGAVTHTLSVAVIICELTGQLSPILPVLIAMLMGNAVCKFLQPSIYESIIRIKRYPYLPDLPPSRQFFMKSSFKLLDATVCTDLEYKILLGSVAKKYLVVLMRRYLIDGEQKTNMNSKRNMTGEIFNTIKRSSMRISRRNRNHDAENRSIKSTKREEFLSEYTISNNTLLAISPLRAPNDYPLISVFSKASFDELRKQNAAVGQDTLLDRTIDLDEVAIDSAPFQLVLGSSLYKVHTLFSLLGLSHAYVTDCGRLVGVIALKELRDALANIYVRGAMPVKPDRKLTSSGYFLPRMLDEEWLKHGYTKSKDKDDADAGDDDFDVDNSLIKSNPESESI